MKTLEVEIDKIEQNQNSRVVYKAVDLSDLMLSMRQDGLLQPVGVRTLKGGKYDAVFGNRRIMAAKKLGWKTIRATLLDVEDERGRDLIGLIENMKRQNTSVSEEGRVLQSLKERGLSIKEMGARLGVTEIRIRHALDVYNEFPDNMKKLVTSAPARQRKDGEIAANLAFAVNNIRKNHNLTKPQTATMLKYVTTGKATVHKLHSAAAHVAAGHSIQSALGMANKVAVITLNLTVNREHVERLERKHKKTIHNLCYEALEALTELRVSRAAGSNTSVVQRRRSERVVIRRAGASA